MIMNGKRRKIKKARRKELTFIIGMLAFPLLQFLIFWGYVNFDSIIIAFKDAANNWSLANFERFLIEWKTSPSRVIQTSIINSLINLAVANLITLPMVILFSYLLFKRCYGYRAFRIIFYLPSIISPVVLTALYAKFVGIMPNGQPGPAIAILQKIGIPLSEEILKYGFLGSDRFGFATIMVYCIWSGIGINLVLLSGALSRVPKEIFESAKIDGCGMFREFFNIVIPLLWPTVTTLFILNLSGTFTMYMPVMLLQAGARGTGTIGYYIVANTIGSSGNLSALSYPAAVGLIFTLIMMPVILIVKKLFEKINKVVEY